MKNERSMKKGPQFSSPPEPNGYFVGTSGWAYDIWQPEFFPEGLPKTKYLQYYASRLTASEVNYTFRSRLAEKTALKWVDETPESFRFVCKAHQYLTHIKRLKDCAEPVRNFADGMTPLFNAHRFGAALFQLPPNLKADVPLLSDFLNLLPRWMKAAVEFRDASWFTDATYDTLHKFNAALCFADTDDLATPEIFTAPFAYYRFRRTDATEADRKKLADRVMTARAKSEEVYVFFKHEELPDTPLQAVELLKRVQGQVPAKAARLA